MIFCVVMELFRLGLYIILLKNYFYLINYFKLMFDNNKKKIFLKYIKFKLKLVGCICILKNILLIFQEGNIDYDEYN